jgi:peptidoglycan/LPS O-acetylase OafA/YrhL
VALAGSYLVVVYLVAELVYGVGGRSVEMPPTAFFGNYFFAVTVFFLVLHYELLEWKRFRYLGEISFGIYLFHRPIRDVLETRVDDLSLRFALVLVASVLISYILNKLIENPCIQLGRRLSR